MQWIAWTLLVVALTVAVSGLYTHTEDEWVRFRRAETLLEGKRFPEAVALYRDARDGGVPARRVLPRLATALLAAGDASGAARVCEELLETGMDEPWIHLALGGARARQGRFDAAEAAYRRALALDPESRKTHILLARVLTAQGDFDAAVDEYRRVLGDSR